MVSAVVLRRMTTEKCSEMISRFALATFKGEGCGGQQRRRRMIGQNLTRPFECIARLYGPAPIEEREAQCELGKGVLRKQIQHRHDLAFRFGVAPLIVEIL